VKIRITVGGVEVRCDGLEMTKRELTHLLQSVASVALAVVPEPDPDPDPKTPIGFSAHIERAEPVEDDFSEFFDE
jgi:hypothetical protein